MRVRRRHHGIPLEPIEQLVVQSLQSQEMGINVLRFPKFRLRAITRAVSIWGDGMDIKIREVGLNAGTVSVKLIVWESYLDFA